MVNLERERGELNALLGKGVSFEVEDWDFEARGGFWAVLRRKKAKKVRRSFRIEELTLGTLDRMALEWVELEIDEAAMKGSDAVARARTLAGRHSRRCARVLALAVLGSDYLVPRRSVGGSVRYAEDKERLDKLTDLFLRSVKPSKLYQLCLVVNAMCNLGDFMNSIRLMSADRTSMPIRVE